MQVPVIAGSLALALVAWTAPSHALGAVTEPVIVAVGDTQGQCTHRLTTVARWTPALGPAARFVVDADAGFVALGRTDDGFWSAQGWTPNDACDDCGNVNLVFTRFSDGSSTRWPLLTGADRFALRADGDGPAREAKLRRRMLSRLWSYAGSVWPVGELRHDYAVVTPEAGTWLRSAPVDEAAPTPPYRGWLVGIVQGGRTRLRFTVERTSHMCWCIDHWRSSRFDPVAAPRRGGE